jgi:hypothetical protein
MSAFPRHTMMALAVFTLAAHTNAQSEPTSPADAPVDAWADANDDAKAAYKRGLDAVERTDYPAATRAFGEADRLSPTDVALKSALKAAVMAGDAAVVMMLVVRGEGRKIGDALRSDISDARRSFAARAGQLVLNCGTYPGCSALVDGKPWPLSQTGWIGTGTHRIEFRKDGRVDGRIVSIRGDALSTLTAQIAAPQAPDKPKPEPLPQSHGWSPVWFWIGVSTSAVLGGVTVASAIDTKNRYDTFQTSGDGVDGGRDAQLRTNVLFFGTIGVALATTAIGIFVVNWDDDIRVEGMLSPHGMVVSGAF